MPGLSPLNNLIILMYAVALETSLQVYDSILVHAVIFSPTDVA